MKQKPSVAHASRRHEKNTRRVLVMRQTTQQLEGHAPEREGYVRPVLTLFVRLRAGALDGTEATTRKKHTSYI